MPAGHSRKHKSNISPQSTLRVVWYSVLIWVLSILISMVVILPWYYLAYTVVILGITAFYFRKSEKNSRGGFRVSLFWFFVIILLDFIEVVAFNFADNVLYISDIRNWIKYVLILLVPIIYTMAAESVKIREKGVGDIDSLTGVQFGASHLP